MIGSFRGLAVGRINLLVTGMTVGCTMTLSVLIRALSGQYVLSNGTPQSSLSTGLEDRYIVLGGFLGLAVGRINLLVRNNCGVHNDTVNINLCSLRPICAEQWYPTVIPLNRVGRLLHCAWRFPWVSRNKQVVRSLVG